MTFHGSTRNFETLANSSASESTADPSLLVATGMLGYENRNLRLSFRLLTRTYNWRDATSRLPVYRSLKSTDAKTSKINPQLVVTLKTTPCLTCVMQCDS